MNYLAVFTGRVTMPPLSAKSGLDFESSSGNDMPAYYSNDAADANRSMSGRLTGVSNNAGGSRRFPTSSILPPPPPVPLNVSQLARESYSGGGGAGGNWPYSSRESSGTYRAHIPTHVTSPKPHARHPPWSAALVKPSSALVLFPPPNNLSLVTSPQVTRARHGH
eukprot:245866-Prorocentrum_minimum.AAC.1